MNPKPNFFSATLLAVCFAVVGAWRPARAGEVTLEDQHLLVTFDSDSGALTKLENKTTHWLIERRPELGVSFRVFVGAPRRCAG